MAGPLPVPGCGHPCSAGSQAVTMAGAGPGVESLYRCGVALGDTRGSGHSVPRIGGGPHRDAAAPLVLPMDLSPGPLRRHSKPIGPAVRPKACEAVFTRPVDRAADLGRRVPRLSPSAVVGPFGGILGGVWDHRIADRLADGPAPVSGSDEELRMAASLVRQDLPSGDVSRRTEPSGQLRTAKARTAFAQTVESAAGPANGAGSSRRCHARGDYAVQPKLRTASASSARRDRRAGVSRRLHPLRQLHPGMPNPHH